MGLIKAGKRRSCRCVTALATVISSGGYIGIMAVGNMVCIACKMADITTVWIQDCCVVMAKGTANKRRDWQNCLGVTGGAAGGRQAGKRVDAKQ